MKEWWAQPTRGLIFEGPSGTGKTLLAKAIASEVDADVYDIKLTDIASSAYVNEWANNVSKMFAEIRQKVKNGKKMIIILDELDALFGNRNNSHSSKEDTKIVNTFLTEMSGMEDLQDVIFIGTTNLVEAIDPAVRRSGRMGMVITVDKPDKAALEQIFDIHITNLRNRSKKFDELFKKALQSGLNISEIVARAYAKWLVGADIKELTRRISENKAHESIAGNTNIQLTTEEFINIIDNLKKQSNNRGIGFLAQI